MSEEEYFAALDEQQRWHNEISAEEQHKEEQERIEAEKKEQAWQEEHHRMLHDEKEIAKRKESLAFVQNLVRLMDSDAANRERERQAAIAAVRASFEHGLERTGYGPFKEDMIIAHAECNLMYPPRTKEWNLKFEKYDVVKDYRAWCWNKMHGSISKGW
jgi:hypothetical protein